MSLRVLKFGGTSVGSAAAMGAAAAIAGRAAREGPILVVVSALAGVTDELAGAIALARDGDPFARDVGRRLRARHLEQLAALARMRAPATPPAAALAAADALDRVLAPTASRLEEILRFGVAPPVACAAILATGERMAAPLFAAALDAQGVRAETIDAAELVGVEGAHEDGEPDVELTRRRASLRLARAPRALVVPGYFGAGADGALRLLGRGGSDTTATLLGAALGAARVEIWTDVDGVFARDPRRGQGAAPFATLDFDAAEALAAAGAKVLHAKAVAPARAAGVPILVRNTFRPGVPGTWIAPAARLALGGRA